jgi:hypothetical protein
MPCCDSLFTLPLTCGAVAQRVCVPPPFAPGFLDKNVLAACASRVETLMIVRSAVLLALVGLGEIGGGYLMWL